MTKRFELTHMTCRALWTVALASILVPTLLFAACSKNDNQAIEDTIRGFFAAYSSQEFSHCLELYSHSLRLSEGDKNIIQWLQHQREWDGSFALKSIGTPVMNKTTATVWVDFETEPYRTVYSWQIYLARENGEWKIGNFWELR